MYIDGVHVPRREGAVSGMVSGISQHLRPFYRAPTTSYSTLIETKDYFDATASNWNTSATVPPGESLCIKTCNQIKGWVFSRFDHVIRGGPKYTNFLASGTGMSVD